MASSASAPAAHEGETLDFKRVFPIFIIVIVDLLALTVIIPMLPLFAVTYGADPLAIGLLSTVFPLFQLAGGPILGSLSDKYGRKPVLIVSQIGTFVGLLMLGFANALWILFASRILDGFTGGNIVAAQAAITDSTTERTRTQGLGLIGAAFGIGFVLGPAISGVALALTGNDFRVPAFIAAGFSGLSILLTTFWFKETLSHESRHGAVKREPLLRRMAKTIVLPGVGVLVALMLMQQVVFGGLESLLALFNLNRLGMSASSNAVVFVFVGVILVAVQGKYIGPWSRKYGERRLVLAGLALLAAGITLTALTPQVTVPWYSSAELTAELAANAAESSALTGITSVALPPDGSNGWLGIAWLLVAMVPCTIGAGLLAPSINSLISKSVPAAEIGGALGVSASMVSLANVIAPVTGGAMFQVWGSSSPFLAGGAVLALLLIVSIRRLPRPKPTPAA